MAPVRYLLKAFRLDKKIVVVVVVIMGLFWSFSGRLKTGDVDIWIINQQSLEMSRDHARDETRCVRT